MIEIIKPIFKKRLYESLLLDTKFLYWTNCPEELEWEFEEESSHYLLIENGVSKATARYRKTKNGYKLERFAVLESERGKGLGHKILKRILFDLSDFKGLIYLHAQVDVIPFYEKIGFVLEGKQFEEAGIQHYKMTLK